MFMNRKLGEIIKHWVWIWTKCKTISIFNGFLQSTTALLWRKIIKEALLAHGPQAAHTLLNPGALLSYHCPPSALSGSCFPLLGL